MKPLVFDLYCGLGGWSEAFIAEGYRAVGFDIEAHDYGNGGYPGELVLRDVRSINGADLVQKYGIPACIVASPPCQEFSYMAMPWSKAKAKRQKIFSDPSERTRLTELFNQCFRIQLEVSAAAGRYIPMVIENVRGAQEWVGRSRWNFGSFHLWGDVPALMPIPGKIPIKAKGSMTPRVQRWMRDGIAPTKYEGVKAGDRNKGRHNGEHKWGTDWDDSTKRSEGNKTVGMNWSDQTKHGQDFTRIAGKQVTEGVKLPSQAGRRTTRGNGVRFTTRDCGIEGVKGFTPNGEPLGKNTLGRKWGSKSLKRKQASAEIAKIPPALAAWIAKCFKPRKD